MILNRFNAFERITRNAFRFALPKTDVSNQDHPFDIRNIHPLLPDEVRNLFDNGHFAQATFEAFKFVDREVARLANHHNSGVKLMMAVFAEASPILKLNTGSTSSERDEQKGFQFLFAGSILAIRNPRGHEYGISESPDECLDHLSMASILLRRLETAGYTLSKKYS